MQLLKQSTSVTIQLGPFLDETNGRDVETGLTITQADIRLSKNGGNFAQTADTGGATHDEAGWYSLDLHTTDTNTLGRLVVAIHESGALPVWERYMVIPANVYDSLVAGSDNLEVDTTLIEGSDATNQINAECDQAISDAALATAAALATVDGNVDAILLDTGTDGVQIASGAVDSTAVAASGANKIADHTIRRSFQNACDSSDGDTKTGRSLLGAIAKMVNKISISGSTLTVTEDDDLTALFTQAITTDSGADPITALDTA